MTISAAGRRLGMAPAAASVRLAKLEYTVGTAFLHGSTRNVALSCDGEAFLAYAREILAQQARDHFWIGFLLRQLVDAIVRQKPF